MDPVTQQPADLVASRQPADLVVTGGRLVTPDGVVPGSVVVTGGRITAIVAEGGALPPGPRLAAAGRYVLPGLIDSHVHFRTPGLQHKEDWAHGSRAALAGGITTVLDMPNTVPPTLDPAAVAAKADLIAGDSWVDYRFHLGADPHRPELLADLDPDVATSAKIFMAGHHTAPTVFRDRTALAAAFAAAATGGVRLVLHAEDQGLFQLLDAWRGEVAGYDQYEPSRPRSGAIVAVARVIDLVREYGTSAHVLHASTAEEADLLAAAGAEGLPVTFEVTGHHLSFTDADTCRLGARTRLSPAIRAQRDQDRLWQALTGGEAACVGSDHAPHTTEEKTRPAGQAPPGLPGVQELAMAVWTGQRRRLPGEDRDVAVTRLVRVLAEAPARLFRLPGKGALRVGADADLVLFDPDRRWMLTGRQVQAKCGWSAYEGFTFTGRVDVTVKAGRVAWDADTGVVGTPTGRWLPAAPTRGDEAPTGHRLADAPAGGST